MIILENASKFILSGINFHVPRGEAVGVIGPSGAGKTTLLKLVCGLLQANSGYVRVMGKEPVGNRMCRKKMSAFFAGVPFLYNEDTVKESFEALKVMYKLPDNQFEEDYRKLAGVLGFGEFKENRISRLSLGERMRAELGAALAVQPELLLLDEPTVGLDANAKAAFRDLLTEKIQMGMTVLITSHDMAEISRICSRIAVLNEGELLYYGSKERLQGYFTPIHSIIMKISGRYPDLEDLPLKSYCQNDNMLTLHYNAQYITEAEILRLILSQTEVEKVQVRKPDLESMLMKLKMS